MTKFDQMMTRLAYSRVLTERFQAISLAINYSLLALVCVIYLIFSTSTWVIVAGSVPGMIAFFVSAQALSYRKAIEGDMMDFLNNFFIR